MKIIALDYGEKRIGVAIGDTETRVAAPLRSLDASNSADFLSELSHVISAEDVQKVVVGLPLTMRGEQSSLTVRVTAFVAELRTRLAVPIETVDERLTSKLADRVKELYGKSFDRDALAAAAILETYFERA